MERKEGRQDRGKEGRDGVMGKRMIGKKEGTNKQVKEYRKKEIQKGKKEKQKGRKEGKKEEQKEREGRRRTER